MTDHPFDVTAPISEGITLLEASAGTGKTHMVSSIVACEVAEGRPLEELLVVTFTRKATGVLRERIRRRLAEVARALATAGVGSGDDLVEHLRRDDPMTVAARRARLEAAVANFDVATIATTHGFCKQVLAGLGIAGDVEPDIELVDSVGDLVADAVTDLFIRRFHSGERTVLFPHAEALRIARAVIQNPDAEIAPVGDSEQDRLRQSFARSLRERIEGQKRTGRLVTYDDLGARVRRSLDDDLTGIAALQRLRIRFTMAIVDEFQDTDNTQWEILDAAFGRSPGRLVLIGDPKQAVYGFRGGDIHCYERAAQAAAHRFDLDVSWRADQPLLDALDSLLDGARLGASSFRHRRMRARPGAEDPRLLWGKERGAALTVRVLDRAGIAQQGRYPTKVEARSCVARDLAHRVLDMLESGTEVIERDLSGVAVGDPRLLGAGDIAVLVRRHADAVVVRDALQALQVPAVVHGGAGVFQTAAAHVWLDLLHGLAQPWSATRLHRVAYGPFVGWDASALATASEEDWDALDLHMHQWAETLRSRGATALLRHADITRGLTARLLGSQGGARLLTDLGHVGELLDESQGAPPFSSAALISWLQSQIGAPDRDLAASRRRVETDQAAVSLHTVHGAKGLEFPVVLLASMWEGPSGDDDDPPVFHDDRGMRSIGVGANSKVRREQVDRAARERDDEELRLLYVALTRARHRAVVWWVTGQDADASPFARLLLGRGEDGVVRSKLRSRPTEDDIRRAVGELCERTAGSVSIEEAFEPCDGIGRTEPAGQTIVTGDRLDLQVASFERTFDDSWRRTSYSALTAAAHDSSLGVTDSIAIDDDMTIDEPEAEIPAGPGDDPALDIPLPLGELPGGPRVGTLIHEILESVDFTSEELEGALSGQAHHRGAANLVAGQVDALATGLSAAIRSPVGDVLAGRCLAELSRADRLDELAFDLPLAGGDTPRGQVTMSAIADVFDAELPPDDPIAGYARRLREAALDSRVRGFLTGSIDLVARVAERFVVIDYKTNRLASIDVPLRAWHYRPESLVDAMWDAHYPLQAALYAVALHRYLRWRLPGYAPQRHLGGIAYLFLRGMIGPDTPVVDGHRCGVFAWQPPERLVTELSDLLDRGAS